MDKTSFVLLDILFASQKRAICQTTLEIKYVYKKVLVYKWVGMRFTYLQTMNFPDVEGSKNSHQPIFKLTPKK